MSRSKIFHQFLFVFGIFFIIVGWLFKTLHWIIWIINGEVIMTIGGLMIIATFFIPKKRTS